MYIKYKECISISISISIATQTFFYVEETSITIYFFFAIFFYGACEILINTYI